MGITTEIFIDKAMKVHGQKYDYSQVDYVNSKTKVKIICKEHGMFEQTPDKHINGKCGCPSCSGNVRNNAQSFINKARLVHGNKYDYSQVDYVSNRKNVKIICPLHGVFEQTPTNHLSGKGCCVCANNQLSTAESFVKKAISVHGQKYDYSKVIYRGNRIPVTIICREHGAFSQKPYSHLSGSGCPECGRAEQMKHRDEVEIHNKAVETFLDKYGVTNPMDIVSVREKQLSSVRSKEVNDKRNATKRKNNSFNMSLSEYRLGEMLKELFGAENVISNYVSDVYPFRCDYYISSRDLYIELNAHWSHGGHWYTDKDAKTIEEWKSKSKFYKNSAETFAVRDVNKRMTAKENQLNYIVFWKTYLSDVQLWIDKGCPDGQDWLREYSWL